MDKVQASRWQEHVESRLRYCKNAFDEGTELGLWDALLFCHDTKEPLPKWLIEALVNYAKRKYGKSKWRGQRQILDDHIAFKEVEYYLKCSYRTKGGKVKRFTLRGACRRVAMDNSRNRNVKTPRDLAPEAIQNVRRAYERGRKRELTDFYMSDLFVRTAG